MSGSSLAGGSAIDSLAGGGATDNTVCLLQTFLFFPFLPEISRNYCEGLMWNNLMSSASATMDSIVLASHPCTCVLQRQLSQLHTLKLPKFFHFHGDFHQNWYFAHPKISFAHPELPFLAKSMMDRQ